MYPMAITEPPRRISLSQKERDILRLIGEGYKSQQIADALCLSLPTIKWYRKQLRIKFGAETTVQMIRMAADLKII